MCYLDEKKCHRSMSKRRKLILAVALNLTQTITLRLKPQSTLNFKPNMQPLNSTS